MLRAHHIRKSYESEGIRTEALRDICLEIGEGEFLAVTGRSGSGKSTLLNVLSTLLSPDSGSLLLDGQEIDHSSERVVNGLRRREFSMVFQMHHLMPYLTALENVLLPFMDSLRPVSGDRKAKAMACLERVGLGGKADRLPGRLSGGEQQRVAIARALVKSPRVLFADEPTGSLDRKTGESIMGILAGLRAEGLTVVMVTHEPDYARIADRIAVMEDGSLSL